MSHRPSLGPGGTVPYHRPTVGTLRCGVPARVQRAESGNSTHDIATAHAPPPIAPFGRGQRSAPSLPQAGKKITPVETGVIRN